MVNSSMNDYLRNLYNQQNQKTLDEKLAQMQSEAMERLKRLANAQRIFEEEMARHVAQKQGIGLLPSKVQKIFDLYSGTDNVGEKSAAEQALKRMGYKIESGKAVKA